jgi:hypothetical protein
MDINSLTSVDKKAWLIRGGGILAGVFGLAVLLPVLWAAFLSALGVLGILITGAIGIGIFWALPMLGQKWENQLLAMRKAEARANPIEQLQNTLLKQKEQIAVAEKALGRISAVIKSQERRLDERQKTHPNHDLTKPRKSIEEMRSFYLAKVDQLKQTLNKCKEYEELVDNAIFEKNLSEEGRSVVQGIKGAEGDYLQKLLADEAFKSISEDFDQLFGDLEVKSILEKADNLELQPNEVPNLIPAPAKERNLG